MQPDAVSCLVVGTESGRVLILNSAGTAITKNVWVGVTPAFLAIQGELEVGYRITVAGRDGKLYSIRWGGGAPCCCMLGVLLHVAACCCMLGMHVSLGMAIKIMRAGLQDQWGSIS